MTRFAICCLLLAPMISQAQLATPPLAYDHIREADIFWKKRICRVIDTRWKLNLPFAYPKESLAELLMNAVEEDALRAYDPAYGDDFAKVMSYEQIIQLFRRIDTEWVWNPEDPSEMIPVPVPRTIDPLSITKFRIKEEWIFDRERSEMVVRVLGIAPVREVIDPNTGEIRGESIMFWIYYPEARPFLASHYAFNPNNDKVKLSWETVFEMRFFDSYIVKEDNVYDREIQTYATDIDAVLEAERIKMALFRFEHELWHY